MKGQLDLLVMSYPTQPGFKSEGTSKAAAESMRPTAATLRAQCLALVKFTPGDGMTADEVARAMRESVLSIRPRITELNKLNLIIDTGERRLNASGRRAVVWKAA